MVDKFILFPQHTLILYALLTSLHLISREHAHDVLEAGALKVMTAYFDFFPIHVQVFNPYRPRTLAHVYFSAPLYLRLPIFVAWYREKEAFVH